jgi:ferredoxin
MGYHLSMSATETVVLTPDGVATLLAALRCQGYRLLGPTARDGAIIYDDIGGIGDLPSGWSDDQEGGRYRLVRRDDGALFGYAVGPHSWKKFLHAPTQVLWRAERLSEGIHIVPEVPVTERLAFIGVRACELRAIEIQDRVLLAGDYADPHYRARRNSAFIVAVNCGVPGGTCFCVSMNAGPKAGGGYDLALTEIVEGEHRFLVESGSDAGRAILAELPCRRAKTEDETAAASVVSAAAQNMGRSMPADKVAELLRRNLDHPRWDEVADRCLSCGNCTMVCPTCFCTTVEDTVSLDGTAAEHVRHWDSCFTTDFSYLHGGSVRASPRSRYRQWMTHKLSSWWDQFGSSGCVGCGRCVTWCPVGIDITEEVAAIRDSDRSAATMRG